MPHSTNKTRSLLYHPKYSRNLSEDWQNKLQVKAEKRPQQSRQEGQRYGLGEKWTVATAVGRELWSQRKPKDRLAYRGAHRENKSP